MMVSTVAAQDTLRIQSLRSVDACANTKRWLLAVSLGKIRFADSLESFDITIGFNNRQLRPTDVLKEGTLSAQMSNGPTMNTVVPGEMRIFGFNVARSVSGDVPLVAVAGDFIGECRDNGAISLPYPPDFNGEFKKRFTVQVVDSISVFITKKADVTKGCRFVSDSLTFLDNDKSRTSSVSVVDNGSDRIKAGFIELKFIGNHAGMSIGDIRGQNCTVDSVVSNNSGVIVYFGNVMAESPLPQIGFQCLRKDLSVNGSFKLESRLSTTDECSCTIPSLLDTLTLVVEKPTVGVSSYDDDSCTIEIKDDLIIGKCLHHGMKELELFDICGTIVQTNSDHDGKWMIASTMILSRGLYFVTMSCAGGWKQKTIVK